MRISTDAKIPGKPARVQQEHFVLACVLFLAILSAYGCNKDSGNDPVPDIYETEVLPIPSDRIPYEALGSGKIVFGRIQGLDHSGFHIIDIDKKTFSGFRLQGNPIMPNISPDGMRIACSMYTPGLLENYFDIYLMNIDGSECQPFFQTAKNQDRCPTWTPDGSGVLFYTATGLLRIQPLVPTDDNSPVILKFPLAGDPVGFISPSGGFSCSINRSLVCASYSSNPGEGILKIDMVWRTSTKLLNSFQERIESPSYSPDGREIAFLSLETDSIDLFKLKSVAVNMIDADGTGLTELSRIMAFHYPVFPDTSNRRWNVSLCWSPDGTMILFTVPTEKKGCHLFVINRDGSGLKQVTDNPEAFDVDVSWGR